MSKYFNENHTTMQECLFIDGLGWYREVSSDGITRAELLRRYIETAGKRQDWGNMDRDAVLSYAEKALEKAKR